MFNCILIFIFNIKQKTHHYRGFVIKRGGQCLIAVLLFAQSVLAHVVIELPTVYVHDDRFPPLTNERIIKIIDTAQELLYKKTGWKIIFRGEQTLSLKESYSLAVKDQKEKLKKYWNEDYEKYLKDVEAHWRYSIFNRLQKDKLLDSAKNWCPKLNDVKYFFPSEEREKINNCVDLEQAIVTLRDKNLDVLNNLKTHDGQAVFTKENEKYYSTTYFWDLCNILPQKGFQEGMVVLTNAPVVYDGLYTGPTGNVLSITFSSTLHVVLSTYPLDTEGVPIHQRYRGIPDGKKDEIAGYLLANSVAGILFYESLGQNYVLASKGCLEETSTSETVLEEYEKVKSSECGGAKNYSLMVKWLKIFMDRNSDSQKEMLERIQKELKNKKNK